MTWECAAIDHGVTIFPNGKIGPCCQIHSSYLKPIQELSNPHRFADLNTEYPPSACEKCISHEDAGRDSYRTNFNKLKTDSKGLQFVDIRNTNHCNLKCRYCGPHFSSSWAKELGNPITVHQSIDEYKDTLITEDLHWMYFTGGEPLINPEHWLLLEELISSKKASQITLLYNTNLTTIKYKNIDVINLWSKFKSVHLQCSIDAIGEPLEYIRSGAKWDLIERNLQSVLVAKSNTNIKLTLTPVISVLNIWFISKLFEYAHQHSIVVNPIVLTGPDYLALDVIPDQLKNLALSHLDLIRPYISHGVFEQMNNLISANVNSCLFGHTIGHVLLLDCNRKEKLFELLPFASYASDTILKNYEYE
jgi:sulfatase maturation enzyme AslB (radical SAM superfamily)